MIFFVVPKFGPHGILNSDPLNFNNLHYEHLCNDFLFFTGIMESATANY